ncbi:ABC-2 type transport system permease protein [Herbihabitans rhizosphaerae]|uniref:ABC-2 type transport system permease protein n=1 Tax=Herbihabitans rhizosphaerae TaxID=1872711 RepID=A0A4Q7L5S9_9PSEU|nr:ABC transporter permease [Herbihabitans rhizosphaerae]RZS45008.1 ABC-2 type transport system permease protein [Herbihabitans rhizosphaerae]
MSAALVGTRQLVRLALRRDRIILPIWILVLSFLPASTAKLYHELYPTEAARQALISGAGKNPSISVIYGPAFDLSTPGGFASWRYTGVIAVLIGLMAIFTVTRHTRAEEDTGRLELLGSTVVGRYAALTAAVLVSAGTSLVIGLLMAFSSIGAGLPAAGSFAMGLGLTLVGWTFTGVAAVCVQIAEFSRTANGIGSAVLGVTYLLRGAGDSSTDATWLSWLSPIGWAQQVRAFAGERWWVLPMTLVFAVAIGSVGYWLLPRRDVGAGVLPARPGPAVAAPGLRSPFALAWRLQKGTLIGWTSGMLLVGAMFGSLASGMGDLIGDSPQAKEIFQRMGGAQSIVDSFIAGMGGMFGIFAALYAVQAVLRMRTEETAVRVEPLLATNVSRLSWVGSHLVFPIVGPAVILAVGGFGMGLMHGLRVGDVGGQLPGALGGALAQLPAVWVVAGISAVLFGLFPKYAMAAWAPIGLFVLITMFGPAVNLSQAIMDVSPFTHIPKLPAAELTMTPLVWLTGIAVVAVAAGMAGFRRRDIG